MAGGSGNYVPWQRTGGAGYTGLMFVIFDQVVTRGLATFLRACIKLPTNLDINQWKMLVDTQEDKPTAEFLQYGFPTGNQRLVPSPSSANYSSANVHPNDLAVYTTTELGQGAVLGLAAPAPLFNPGVKSALC